MVNKTVDLTPRQVEVVILVGRDRLSYKAAAKQLENKHGDGTISHRTVRHYCVEIRNRLKSDLSPRDAVTAYYWLHQDELDDAA